MKTTLAIGAVAAVGILWWLFRDETTEEKRSRVSRMIFEAAPPTFPVAVPVLAISPRNREVPNV